LSLCIIASLRAEPALGAIYAFRTPFQDFANLTEGELFSADDSPLGISHPVVPVVALQGSLALPATQASAALDALAKRAMETTGDPNEPSTGAAAPPEAMLHAWIFNADDQPGWEDVCSEPPASTDVDKPSHAMFAPTMTGPGGRPAFDINLTHVVYRTGVHYAFLKVCDKNSIAIETEFRKLKFDWHAKLVFRNPYGYTPARMYGLMPFYGLDAGMLGAALVCFSVLMFRHRDQLIPLHVGIAAIMCVAVLEAVLTYNAWMQVNELGPALCYPTCGTPFLAAIVISQMKSTLSRAFLLVVCMGLGVTRARFEMRVWGAIAGLHLVYFVTSLNVDIQDVSNIVSGATTDAVWTMPQVLSDLLIIMWIFLAISHTQKKLKQERQTLKLKMYVKLVRIISFFTAFWMLFVVLLLLKDAAVIPWPWRYAWVWQAFGHVGYFFILCAVSWSWGPSQVSSQLAHSQQIAMTEDDADQMELSNAGARRGSGVNSEDVDIFRLEDDDDEDEESGVEDDDDGKGTGGLDAV
jgi:hypothetical protein